MADYRYKARPHQMQVLQSKKKFIFLGAGVGSGKTDIGTFWMLNKAKNTPPGVIGMIGANSYTQLIDSTCRNIYKNLIKMGIPVKPKELPAAHRPFSLKVWINGRWVEVLCRSLENFELLSGIEFGWWWVDEAWQTEKPAIDLLHARLRDSSFPGPLQGLITTTLDDPDSWMYDFAVDDLKPDLTEVIYATTYDNLRNLPDGYVDSMKAMYSPALFQRMVEAKWVSLVSSKIYTLSRLDNVSRDAEYDQHLPICWAFDFNIGQNKPMSSVLAQIKKVERGGKVRQEVHVFDEIIVNSADTRDLMEEFKGRGWQRPGQRVAVYGDASGRARDSRSRTTDYDIIALAGFREQLVPLSNPPIRDRHNSVNAMLKNAAGDIRLKIHPRCKTLIKGLDTVKLKKGSGYIEEESRQQHATTALGYFIYYEFPVRQYRSSGERYWK